MRRNQLRQTIGPFPAFAHVIVIESVDRPDFFEPPFPVLHPRGGDGRSSAGREKEQDLLRRVRIHNGRGSILGSEPALAYVFEFGEGQMAHKRKRKCGTHSRTL